MRKGARLTAAFAIALFAATYAPCAHAANANAARAGFVPSPRTEYAREFVAKSGGAGWFLDEVERLLNVEQKSVNTLASRFDLRNIVSLAHSGDATEIPPAIGELYELRELFMANNRLAGIPAELFSLSALRVADLSHNRLEGPIPEGFKAANLPNLRVLLLWDNRLEGSIPDTLYTLTNLENLDLSVNKLSGGLSPSVGNFARMKLFAASRNRLSGEIPAAFGSLPELKALMLWGNALTGNIPDAFGASRLETLDLADNGLSGPLPPNLPVTLRKFAARNNELIPISN